MQFSPFSRPVPNDVPGSQRSGTPPPKKKKISFTTTISDDEDEKPVLKKQKDAQKKQTKPLKERSNKKTDKMLNEKETTDKMQTKKGKKTENSPVVEIESSDPDVEIKPPVKEIETNEREGDAHETETNEVERDREEQFVDATEKNTDEAKEKKVVKDMPELKEADNSEEKSEDAREEVLLDEDEKNLEENAAEISDNAVKSLEKPTNEDRVEKVEDEVEHAEEFSDLPTPPQLPSTTDDNEDDVLEIQTSLDDVRQLHTPSSRQSTPKSRSRLDSGDSDCSFKSASDNAKLLAGQAIEETEQKASKAPNDDEDQQTAATIIGDPIDSPELPAELMTPPSAVVIVVVVAQRSCKER